MKLPVKCALAAAIALSGAGVVATSASAAVVCNAQNECWHVRGPQPEYKPEWNITVHPDDWKWNHDDHYRWREHRGRGYWRDGVWIKF